MIANIPIGTWALFLGFVGLLLALDLGVFHRKAHKVEMREALIWSGIWIGLALAFNGLIAWGWDRIQPGSPLSNQEAGIAFFTGYLIEKALSVDNIFVFLITFAYFKVPDTVQHRVLFWGIIGALIFRAIFVAAGSALLHQFHWMMIVFGVFLLITGIKMIVVKGKQMDPGKNPLLKLLKKVMPVTEDFHGEKFFTRVKGKLWATPLFAVLLVVEFTDVIFAVDSIPAIFAITSDPFLVFTSNVFAILGLRSLFFVLAGLMDRFHLLGYGLAAVLMFVGGKMIYGWIEKDWLSHLPSFPVVASLGIIAAILAVAMIASVRRPLPKAG